MLKRHLPRSVMQVDSDGPMGAAEGPQEAPAIFAPSLKPGAFSSSAYTCSICMDLLLEPVVGECVQSRWAHSARRPITDNSLH